MSLAQQTSGQRTTEVEGLDMGNIFQLNHVGHQILERVGAALLNERRDEAAVAVQQAPDDADQGLAVQAPDNQEENNAAAGVAEQNPGGDAHNPIDIDGPAGEPEHVGANNPDANVPEAEEADVHIENPAPDANVPEQAEEEADVPIENPAPRRRPRIANRSEPRRQRRRSTRARARENNMVQVRLAHWASEDSYVVPALPYRDFSWIFAVHADAIGTPAGRIRYFFTYGDGADDVLEVTPLNSIQQLRRGYGQIEVDGMLQFDYVVDEMNG